jgi:small-conductance mechanosensitive channel
VGVHYDSDLGEVERITLEVAREVMRSVEGGVPGAEPRVRFHTFAESSVNLRVLLRAADYDSAPRLRHEFIKRLHRRYRREGIIIPYPIRTLDLPPDSATDPRRVPLSGPGEEAGPGSGAN